MKNINGLYISLVIVFFVQLTNTTIFADQYSGIAMFISLGVFIFGSAFYVVAKRQNTNEQR